MKIKDLHFVAEQNTEQLFFVIDVALFTTTAQNRGLELHIAIRAL